MSTQTWQCIKRDENTTPFVRLSTEDDVERPGTSHASPHATNPFLSNTISGDQCGRALGGLPLPAFKYGAADKESLAAGLLIAEDCAVAVAEAEKSSIP
jgi:hypothetical protein